MSSVSPQGYKITKDPTNTNPFWESESYDPQALLPSGGSTGNILVKKSANNYDTKWEAPTEYVTPETLSNTVTNIMQKVTDEAEARENSDIAINERIDKLNIPDIEPLEQEIADTNARIDNLNIPDITRLTNEVTEVKQTVTGQGNLITALTETVGTYENNMTAKVNSEIEARIFSDNELSEKITNETEAREQFETNVRQVPEASISDSGKVLTVDNTGNAAWAEQSGGGGSYTLPQATEDVLGGVKAKAKTTETVEVAIDTDSGKLYVPEQSGGGGSSEPVLLASYGDLDLSSLTGGTTVSSGSLKLTKAVDIFANMVNYKMLGVSLIMPSASNGVVGAMFYNPYYGKTMSTATKAFTHTFMIKYNILCTVDFSLTGSDYTPTITLKFISNTGAVISTVAVIGAAVYGIN